MILDLYGTNHDARIWGDPHAFRPERFLDHTPGPFEFVPQGGGRVEDGHRCPGEGIAVALMKEAVDVLVHRIDYAVPRQSLRLRMHRLPALPVEGFRMRDIRRRAPARPA